MLSKTARLESWSESPLGQYLYNAESALMAEMLAQCIGYYLLDLGPWPCPNVYAHTPIKRQFHLYKKPIKTSLSYLQCDLGALPVKNDSVDVCILRHVLERFASPHLLLREVERVLVADGHLIISGFNPYSLWGLKRVIGNVFKRPPFDCQFISARRLADWLELLGFELLMHKKLAFIPPINHASTIKAAAAFEPMILNWWQHGGGAYIMFAKKKRIALTPIKPKWRVRRALSRGNGAFEPSARTKNG